VRACFRILGLTAFTLTAGCDAVCPPVATQYQQSVPHGRACPSRDEVQQSGLVRSVESDAVDMRGPAFELICCYQAVVGGTLDATVAETPCLEIGETTRSASTCPSWREPGLAARLLSPELTGTVTGTSPGEERPGTDNCVYRVTENDCGGPGIPW
jgi:hypothetical protein